MRPGRAWLAVPFVVACLAGAAFGVYRATRPGQHIEDVLSEIKPGWTEVMVLRRFPSMRKRNLQLHLDDPESPTDDVLKLDDAAGEDAQVHCFMGEVVEVWVHTGRSARKVWGGDVVQDMRDYVQRHPTAKMRAEAEEMGTPPALTQQPGDVPPPLLQPPANTEPPALQPSESAKSNTQGTTDASSG